MIGEAIFWGILGSLFICFLYGFFRVIAAEDKSSYRVRFYSYRRVLRAGVYALLVVIVLTGLTYILSGSIEVTISLGTALLAIALAAIARIFLLERLAKRTGAINEDWEKDKKRDKSQQSTK